MKNSTVVKKLFLIFLVLTISLLSADKGMISIIQPELTLYNSAQRAVLVWNGKYELLVLSTNVSAQESTPVLEILPLPHKPKVEKGDFEIFHQVHQMINAKSMQLLEKNFIQERKGTYAQSGVQILFQKKIGAHFITCVHALDYKEFLNWTRNFLKSQNFSMVKMPDRLQKIIEHYLESQINYFVFDIINLNSQETTVEPLVYQFKSLELYFPLFISNLAEGKSEIQLYTITPGIIDIWDIPYPLQYAYYELEGEKIRPIVFPITKTEFKTLFPNYKYSWSIKNLYLSVFRFYGYLSQLKNDLRVKRILNHTKY